MGQDVVQNFHLELQQKNSKKERAEYEFQRAHMARFGTLGIDERDFH